MNKDKEEARIAYFKAAETSMVHVDDPDAYGAFRDGKVLFDVTETGERILRFIKKNRSEFGDVFEQNTFGLGPGFVCYTVFHKHIADQKYIDNVSWPLEKDHPELFE